MVAVGRDRRGIGKLGCGVWILLIAVAVYLGSSFGKPWFAYQEYRDEMKSSAAFAEALSDSAILARIVIRADSLMLPVAARNVTITRGTDRIVISSAYDVVVNLFLYGPVVLKFRPTVEGPL